MDVNKINTTRYRWLWDYVHEYCRNMFIWNKNSNIGCKSNYQYIRKDK